MLLHVIDEAGDLSNDVKQASKVMDEIQDTMESGIGEGGLNTVDDITDVARKTQKSI